MDVRSLGGHFAELSWVAVRSLFTTVLAVGAYGGALAGGAYAFLRERPLYGLAVAGAVMVEALVVAVLLGGRRAVVAALVHGLRKWQLGQALVRLLFERFLRVQADEEPGERGGTLARAAERVPLAQAERLLNRAAAELVNAPATDGGVTGRLRRRIYRAFSGAVHTYTLANLRSADSRHGGIDLALLRADLEARADETLTAKLQSGLTLWTVLAVVGLAVAAIIQTYVAMAFLQPK